MLTKEQKLARMGGIGGSDAAVVAGFSPWKTPVQLWMEKTSRIPEKNLDDVEFVQWGHLLEDVIGKEWARRESKTLGRHVTVRRVSKNGPPVVHAEFPWMLGSIDFEAINLGREPEGLEVKNASIWTADKWGDPESDQLPDFYLAQCVHYMAVRNRPAWNVAVLLGGNELRRYRITRDLDIEKQLINLESKFWECVVEDRSPPPLKIEDLALLYPATQGAIVGTDELALALEDFKKLKLEVKELEVKLDAIKLGVGTYMGEHGDLVSPYDSTVRLATYRSHKENRVDTKFVKEGGLAEAIHELVIDAVESGVDAESLGMKVADVLKACTKEGTVRKFLAK